MLKKLYRSNVLKTGIAGIISFLWAIPIWAATGNSATTKVVHTVFNTSGKLIGTGIANNGGFIGAGLSMGLAAIGAGIGVGYVGAAVVGSVSEKPENMGKMLIFLGLAEGIAIYGLLIAIMILVKIH